MTIERLQELKYNFEMQSNNGYADFIGKSECELAISLIDEKISQLSVTDEDVREAIEYLKDEYSTPIKHYQNKEDSKSSQYWGKQATIAITALQQMDAESYGDDIYRLKEMFGLSVDEKVGNKTFRMVIKRKDAQVIWEALQQMQKAQELEKENQGLKKMIEDMQRNLDAWNPRQSFNEPTTGNPMPQTSYTTSSNKTDLVDGKLR